MARFYSNRRRRTTDRSAKEEEKRRISSRRLLRSDRWGYWMLHRSTITTTTTLRLAMRMRETKGWIGEYKRYFSPFPLDILNEENRNEETAGWRLCIWAKKEKVYFYSFSSIPITEGDGGERGERRLFHICHPFSLSLDSHRCKYRRVEGEREGKKDMHKETADRSSATVLIDEIDFFYTFSFCHDLSIFFLLISSRPKDFSTKTDRHFPFDILYTVWNLLNECHDQC